MKTKVYVISGTTSGIGLELLKKLVSDECNVIFAGYRNDKYKNMLSEFSSNIYPFFIDYTIPESVLEASEYIKSKTEKIDTLINIAGCVVAGPIEKIDINEIRRQFNVNVFGHLDITQRLAELLSGGKIINVSSMASFGFFPFVSPYCASKRSLDILFNAFQVENKKNIKVVSIKPGVISTPLWSKSVEENSKYFEKFEEYSDEMKYVIQNAKDNETNGLSVDKVVNTILHADKAKNPKLSYTVGNDAFFAKILSKFPQRIINYVVKQGIKYKCKKG